MRSGTTLWRGWVRRYELLIFDWDGTLVDSIGRIVLAIRRAAEACALPPLSDTAIKGIIGLAMPEAVAALYPQLRDSARIASFQRCYAEHYLALEMQPSPFYPEVPRVLAELQEAGYRLAVATGKSRRGLDRVMSVHGWMDFFDITRCADETASKPDPLMLNEILSFCGVGAEKAVMVGDSVFDIQMAQRAGMAAVAVSYGAQAAAVLRECQPDFMIDRFEQLADWLVVGHS